MPSSCLAGGCHVLSSGSFADGRSSQTGQWVQQGLRYEDILSLLPATGEVAPASVGGISARAPPEKAVGLTERCVQ